MIDQESSRPRHEMIDVRPQFTAALLTGSTRYDDERRSASPCQLDGGVIQVSSDLSYF